MKAALAVCLAGLLAVSAHAESTAEPTQEQIDAAFKKADPDNDGTVSLKEARKFGITKAAFEHANPDKDGTLDKQEFVAAIKYQFEHANPDKDKTLDKKEAAKAGVKQSKSFTAANPDKDGTLDMAEYLDALVHQAK